MSSNQRSLLFLNLGDESLLMAKYSILHNLELPKWAWPYREHLSADDAAMYYDGVPFGLREDIRDAVRKLYYHPAKSSTIHPITDDLRPRFCNVTKTRVRNILMSFPTYQRNFGRRRPRMGQD